MKIIDVLLTKSYTGFYFDDQKAIRKGATLDGILYVGEPLTPSFEKIRVPGEAISIQLVLDDGSIALGDCAAVQYSGAGGRDPLFLADRYIPFMETYIKPYLLGKEITTFKEMASDFDAFKINGERLHTAIRYGVSQALLSAVAHKEKITMAEVIRNEYNPELTTITSIPVFAQSGDDRYNNVDKMILKEIESLPHALINNVEEKLGLQGEKLIAYIKWLKNRIVTQRINDDYHPIIHIDVYGTIGIAFDLDIDKMAAYFRELETTTHPFKLRIEGPVDAGSRKETMEIMKTLREKLREDGTQVEIVADEWCNTLDDVKYFADHQAADMIQIKTPDLGGLHNVAEAILYCKEKGVGAYCGGTCNETNISTMSSVHVALGAGADVCLAKPGMDVDSGYMITKNEMERAVILAKR